MQACQATGRPWCRATPSPSGAPGHGRWCRQCCRSTCRRASRPRRRATLALALALTSACLSALHGDAGVDAAMEAGAEAGVECAMSRMGCVAAHAHSAGKGSWFLRPADACGGHVSHGSGGAATDPGAGAARAADEAQGDAELVQDADKAVLGRTITTAERLGQMLAREVESSALLILGDSNDRRVVETLAEMLGYPQRAKTQAPDTPDPAREPFVAADGAQSQRPPPSTAGPALGVIPGLQGDQNFWFRWKPATDLVRHGNEAAGPGTPTGSGGEDTFQHLGLPESDDSGRSAGDEAANLVVFVMIPGLGDVGEDGTARPGSANGCSGEGKGVRCFSSTMHTGRDTIKDRHSAEARVRHVLGWAETSLNASFCAAVFQSNLWDAATHEDIATNTTKRRLYAQRFEAVVTALRRHRLTRDGMLISRSTPVPLSMMTRGNQIRFGKNCSRIETVNALQRGVVASLVPAVRWLDWAAVFGADRDFDARYTFPAGHRRRCTRGDGKVTLCNPTEVKFDSHHWTTARYATLYFHLLYGEVLGFAHTGEPCR